MKNFILVLLLLIGSFGLYSQQSNKQKLKLNLSEPALADYSDDQQFVGIADGDEIKIFTSATFRLSRILKSHSRTVTAVDFSPDGSFLLTGSLDKKIFRWDYINGLPIDTLKLHEPVIGAKLIDNHRAAIITEVELIVVDLLQKKEIYHSNDHKKAIRSLATSADGKLIATGASDGSVFVYDAGTGNRVSTIQGHKNFVRTIAISHDGSHIASGDDDGLVLIHTADGKLVFTFREGKGWIRSLAFSLDGKYVSAGDDWGNIVIYSIEKGLLTEKIEGAKVPILAVAFTPDGKEMTFIEQRKGVSNWDVSKLDIAPIFKFRDQKDVSSPQIFVANPPNIQNDKIRFSKDVIDIRGTVMDESGVRSLRINSVDVPLKENGNFIIYLPLRMGDNAITIEAKDINDNISVKKFIIHRRSLDGLEYDVSKARNFLFVVSINDYEQWPKLNNAVKDANDITNVLLQNYQFQFENVTVLKNEQATRTNIYKGLRTLIEKITPQDNLVIYFSGHGFFDELLNEGYWVPVEAKTSNSGEYLSNSDILKIIGNIDSQHTLLIADACFSGSLFADSKKGFADNVERYKSRWGLTSGRLEVVSDGEIGKNSPFASAILQYLTENQKDKITASELVQYVKLNVPESAKQTPVGNPLKVSGDEGGELVLHRKK